MMLIRVDLISPIVHEADRFPISRKQFANNRFESDETFDHVHSRVPSCANIGAEHSS